jgi:hypothetical protein
VAEKRSEPNSQPKLPDNWTPDGLSKGAQTGPVRKSPDACNERRRGK